MQRLSPALFALCLFPGLANAQGDECTDPLAITVGANGPYTNLGATSSAPLVWPCEPLPVNDIWFVAMANANGSATFDTCGSSLDTVVEVFDGTAGCNALVSIGCNDDDPVCTPQSVVTVPVTPGQLLLIRVGGWNGSVGSFTLNVAGDIGTATGVASAPGYGDGCYNGRASFFELIPNPANFDLSNSAFTMLPNNGGYTMLTGIAGFVTPTANATVVTLGDDSASPPLNLTTPFPYDGTTVSTLVMYSNGFVSTGSTNATVGTIVTSRFFNEDAAWRNWHDYDPSQGGQVTFEEVGTTAYFTWTNVPDYGVVASSSTFQIQFDSSNGAVTFVFQQMSLTGGGGGGHGHMIGYSPSGPSLQPDPTDISAALPATFSVHAIDSFELTLVASDRPVLGSAFSLDTTNVPTIATLGAQVLSFTEINPGVDLVSLGMPDCRQYVGLDASVILVPAAGAASYPISLPSDPAFAGTNIYSQSVMLVPGVNAFGGMTSNGVALRVDIN